ncbi:CHAP domain-containing protein [Nonomuraea turkmeniaca]|uniref:CHAP domain-containing protein n=1 Tax=Nonomuraea turkmeniaca TaxID=103838 RepID=A0A5S4FSG6_9ACTN|nr:CHAP domain-containing protein [Nonomuraea turkmeniaca]TMR23573.1 CHAP domain-containing protein [Nonomuraea turkmeniaca]
MAKHDIFAANKINLARAALASTVLASAFTAHVTGTAVAATDKQPVAVAEQAGVKAQKTTHETKVSVTADQVLAFAKSQVGTSENAAGGGTKYQQWYANSQRAAETIARDGGNRTAYLNAAWCAMFVSWVGEQTGARPQIGWDAWTVAHAKWFKANSRFGTLAKPGAVVFFSWSGSKDISDINHVGFVVKDNQNGTISTIEGNTGNGKVEERTRPKSQVVGYGYPEYAA